MAKRTVLDVHRSAPTVGRGQGSRGGCRGWVTTVKTEPTKRHGTVTTVRHWVEKKRRDSQDLGLAWHGMDWTDMTWALSSSNCNCTRSDTDR